MINAISNIKIYSPILVGIAIYIFYKLSYFLGKYKNYRDNKIWEQKFLVDFEKSIIDALEKADKMSDSDLSSELDGMYNKK